MNKAKYIALGIAMVFGFGWFTSTRHLDYAYLIEGKPLSGCIVTVLDGASATGETQFRLDESGSVRFPARFEGKMLGIKLSRNDEILRSFFTTGLSRGENKINYLENSFPPLPPNGWRGKTPSGFSTITTFSYRFLWFSKTEENQSWDFLQSDEAEI